MDRFERLRKHINKNLGMEIAPYFNPIASKQAGYNVVVVDVYDQPELLARANKDGNIPPAMLANIEQVDIVSNASALEQHVEEFGLAGKLSWILSSHNFEHLPDPIAFLRVCYEMLESGGILTMAIPDYRACFDHFRFPTRLSDWILAYENSLQQPHPATRFDYLINNSYYDVNGAPTVGCDFASGDANRFMPCGNLRSAYDEMKCDLNSKVIYKDAHCSVLFPKLFELLITDLNHLGLVDLRLTEVTATEGLEFFVYLQKPHTVSVPTPSEEEFYHKRTALLRSINSQLGSAPLPS